MSLNSKLKNLKFLLNAGISVFIQNSPRTRYHINKQNKNTNQNFKITSLEDIKTLNELQKFMINSNILNLKNGVLLFGTVWKL